MPRTNNPAGRSRAALGWLLLATGMLGLSGCTAAGTPAPPPTAQGGQSSSDTALDAERDAYDLKLAACLRSAGFDIEDPQPGQGIQESGPEINAAAATCRGEIGDPPTPELSADDTAAIQETYLEWAKCLRELGYDVADPAVDQAFAIPENATEEHVTQCTEVAP